MGARKGHAGGVGRSRPIGPEVDSIGSLEEIGFWPLRMAPARRSFPGDRLGACVCVLVCLPQEEMAEEALLA